MKSIFLFMSLFLLFPGCLLSQPAVTVQGRNIKVNGSAYIIRGVCYNPIAIGDDRFKPLDFSHIDQDILLMTQAKINTIRTFVPITDESILNKFADAGIKIIIGFPNYDDTKLYPDISSGTYLEYINKYKDHNAILMWELGNEYNYHPEWFSNDINNWYTILNNAASAIHSADPNHPVSTAHGEVPASAVLSQCPNVDVWGMNVYRWDNPSAAINEYTSVSAKPCYFSESGADRYNNTQGSENQQQQADADLAIWNNIEGYFDKCSGITFFSFVDEWWKSGNVSTHDATGFSMSVPYDNYANEEWWGLVDIYRNITLAYSELKDAFINSASGVEDNSLQQTSLLYPNPANNKTILRFSEPVNEKIVLKISAITGDILVSKPIVLNGNEIEIPLDQYKLSDGIYFISAVGKSIKVNALLIKQE